MLRTVYLAEQKIVFILKARSGFSRAQCLSHWLGVTLKFSSKEKKRELWVYDIDYWFLIMPPTIDLVFGHIYKIINNFQCTDTSLSHMLIWNLKEAY